MQYLAAFAKAFRPWLIAIICCLWTMIAAAGEIETLVSGLNAPTRGEREAAERALLELGPAVLSELPETAGDPATQAALSRIREQLFRDKSIHSVTHPTRVSITGEGPLGEVAGDWLDEAGMVRIALTSSQRSRRVSLEVNDLPYWEAIDKLAADARLWPEAWDERGRLTFRQRRAADADIRLTYAGAFRIAGGPVRKMTLAGGEATFLYRLPIAIRAEPGVRPLFIEYEADSGTLTTRSNKRLEPFTPSASYELPVGQAGGTARLRLKFTGPDVGGPLMYQGTFVATIAAGQAEFVYDIPRDGFRPAQQEEGSVSTRLRDVNWDGDTVSVELAVVYQEGGPAFESYRTWVYHNDAVLVVERENERDLVIPHEPVYDILAHSPGALLLRYKYQGVPEHSARLVLEYHAPTEIVEVPLGVELAGLAVE